jgi:hypothetical protein
MRFPEVHNADTYVNNPVDFFPQNFKNNLSRGSEPDLLFQRLNQSGNFRSDGFCARLHIFIPVGNGYLK